MDINDIVDAFFKSNNNFNNFLRLVSNDKSSDLVKRKMFDLFIDKNSDKNDDKDKKGTKNFASKGLKGIFNLIKDQEESYIPRITDQILKLSDAEELLLNYDGSFKGVGEIWKNLKDAPIELFANQIKLYLNEQNALLKEINNNTSLTGDLSKDYRDELTKTIAPLTRIGVGLDEITKSTVSLINQTGRFSLLSSNTWIESAKVAKAYVGTLDEMISSFVSFEKAGIGAKDTTRYLEDAGRNSMYVGIESRKVTKDIQENIGKINQYGFKNSIQGLSELVKKSIEFRMNVQTTFNVAEKLFDLNSVLDMSANLQVLGGAIGDFADPLKLMYMATNDINGLQDAIVGMGKDLVTFQNGSYGIVGANLRIARDRAQALGMDYQEFANIAIASNQKIQASTDLLGAKIKGKVIDDDLKEFLTNMAQMDKGELKITIPEKLQDIFKKQEISLKDLSGNEELLKTFKTYQDQFKQLSKEEIIEKQANNIENIERYVSFMAASVRVQGGKTVGKLADLYGLNFVEKIKDFTKDFTKTEDGKMYGEGVFKKISEVFGLNINDIKKSMNVNNLTLPNLTNNIEKEQASKKETPISKQELTILIKNDGGVLLDAITREIVKDPSFAKTIRELIVKENDNKN